MSIQIRKASDRGHVNHGWLDTYHTFSFSSYQDPDFMGFSDLRVINEDFVDPERGFQTHGHQDMEILTVVVEGVLEHQDSLGNGSKIPAGDVQVMSAGTGIRHSEVNPSKDRRVHLFQIWIHPEREGLKPGYGQATIEPSTMKNQLLLMAGKPETEALVPIHQDARVYRANLEEGKTIEKRLPKDRRGYVQMISGEILLGGTLLKSGDGAFVENEERLIFEAKKSSDFLFFDLR